MSGSKHRRIDDRHYEKDFHHSKKKHRSQSPRKHKSRSPTSKFHKPSRRDDGSDYSKHVTKHSSRLRETVDDRSKNIRGRPIHEDDQYSRSRLVDPVIIKDEPDVVDPMHWGSDLKQNNRAVLQDRSQRRRIHAPVILKDDADDVDEMDFKQIKRDDESLSTNSGDNFGSPIRGAHNATQNMQRSGALNTNPPVDRQKANFALSGKLAQDTNMFKGVLIKYNEPEDARIPTEHWRLYPFKGTERLPILHIHRQSGFLVGRDKKVADIPMYHPSISKQHAALQYRYVKGDTRLYVIDLDSVNGTFLNNNKINPRRYYELRETDMVKFGFSSREYVVMTTNQNAD